MSVEHVKTWPCYLCGRYFGAHKILKNHNISTHKEYQDMTEIECEENDQVAKDKKKAKKKIKNKQK